MVHILIGFAEALPAPEVFFSLHAAGHRVSAFTRAGSRAPLARFLPLEAVHELPAPEKDAVAAVAGLNAVLDAAGAPDLVFPLDDAALWLVNTARPDDPRIIGATGARARLALDKTLQLTAAQQAGFAVPPTRVIRQPADLDGDLPLPAIAKPALAIAAQGGRIAKDGVVYLHTREAVRSLACELQADMAPLLVQQMIAGQGEGIFGIVGPEGVSHWSGHRRLRMMNPHGSGSSASIAHPPEPALRAATERFMQATGWRGPFMIELLRDADGTAWFMELNGRMWGSMALARGQGLEYPAWAVAQTRDPTFRPPDVTLPKTPLEARHLGRDLLHLLFVLRGPRDPFFAPGWPRFTTSLRAVLRHDRGRRLYNQDPDFPNFARREALDAVLRSVWRR